MSGTEIISTVEFQKHANIILHTYTLKYPHKHMYKCTHIYMFTSDWSDLCPFFLGNMPSMCLVLFILNEILLTSYALLVSTFTLLQSILYMVIFLKLHFGGQSGVVRIFNILITITSMCVCVICSKSHP